MFLDSYLDFAGFMSILEPVYRINHSPVFAFPKSECSWINYSEAKS